MKDSARVERFLPLTHLLYAVLLSLAETPDYPYQLVERIRDRSDGRLDPGTGSFYTVLGRAERQGLIREVQTREDARRRIFEITALGREVLAAEAERLAAQLRETSAILLRTTGKKAT